MFSKANKALNSDLKQLVNESKIAGTVHKNPLTTEIIQKLYDVGELATADMRDPRALLQTGWPIVSVYMYFGKRARENQISLKKLKRCLVPAAKLNGEEFFELKVTVYLQIDNFLKIWILGSKYWPKCDL